MNDRIEQAARAIHNAILEGAGSGTDWDTTMPPEVKPIYRNAARAASAVLGDQGLRKAAQDFVNKLEMVEPAINGAFAFQAIHGANYDGPNYGEELNALKAALTRQDGPVIGEEQPPYKKCGKVAQTFIAREGSFFPCALEEGHEGPCLQSGTCFRHGIYFGKNCPHWPKCADQLLAPRREPSHPMSGTMQDEVRVTDRPQETSQQEADSLKLKCLSCNSEVENPACQVCGAIMVPAYLLKLGYRLSADGTFWIPPVNESVGKWIRKCIAVEKERDDLKIKLKAIEEQKAVPQSGQPPSQQEASVQPSGTEDVVERALPWDVPSPDRKLYELICAKPPENRTPLEFLAKRYIDLCAQAVGNCDTIRLRAQKAEREVEEMRAGWRSWESVEKAIYDVAQQNVGGTPSQFAGRVLAQLRLEAEPAERVTVHCINDPVEGDKWHVHLDGYFDEGFAAPNKAERYAAGLRAELDAQGGNKA